MLTRYKSLFEKINIKKGKWIKVVPDGDYSSEWNFRVIDEEDKSPMTYGVILKSYAQPWRYYTSDNKEFNSINIAKKHEIELAKIKIKKEGYEII